MGERLIPPSESPSSPAQTNRSEATNDANSARFLDIPEAANNDLYDRRKTPKPEKLSSQIAEKVPSKYLALALSPDGGLEEAIETGKYDTIEGWLLKNQFLITHGERLIISDTKKLSSLKGEVREGAGMSYLPKEWLAPSDLQDAFSLSKDSLKIAPEDFFNYFCTWNCSSTNNRSQ